MKKDKNTNPINQVARRAIVFIVTSVTMFSGAIRLRGVAPGRGCRKSIDDRFSGMHFHASGVNLTGSCTFLQS